MSIGIRKAVAQSGSIFHYAFNNICSSPKIFRSNYVVLSSQFRCSSSSVTSVKLEVEVIKDDKKVVIDNNLINHLERTSLVDFDNEEALQRLQEAIKFADTLFQVDTTGVEPMTSVLEQETLWLRDDVVEKTSREDIMSNAIITEEDYFVAPPGNIPLEQNSKKF